MRPTKFKFSLQHLLGFREHFTGSVSSDPQRLLIYAKLDHNTPEGVKKSKKLRHGQTTSNVLRQFLISATVTCQTPRGGVKRLILLAQIMREPIMERSTI